MYGRARRTSSPAIAALILLATFQAWPLSGAAEPLRLQLHWLHPFQFAGYYMALEKGFYQQAELDVEILEGGPERLKPIDALRPAQAWSTCASRPTKSPGWSCPN